MSKIQGIKSLIDIQKKEVVSAVPSSKKRNEQKEVNSQTEYEFTNLPINRVIQNFL